MVQPAWERSKQRKLRRYIRRQPEESVLYRIVYHYRDELEQRWDELFLERYGSLRREVLDTLNRYLSCGKVLVNGEIWQPKFNGTERLPEKGDRVGTWTPKKQRLRSVSILAVYEKRN